MSCARSSPSTKCESQPCRFALTRGPAARLAAVAGVQRVPTRELELFIVRGFLDRADLRRADRADRRAAAAVRDRRRPRDRQFPNQRNLRPRLARSGRRRGRPQDRELLGLPPDAGEPLQGQRYAPGQEFKPHTDTFEPGGYDFYVHTADNGQRTWTAMIYLNQPEDGGATRFKTIGKTVQPETGKLLAWNNLLPDGRPNPATLHQGMKVRRGTKYVLTKWFRELG